MIKFAYCLLLLLGCTLAKFSNEQLERLGDQSVQTIVPDLIHQDGTWSIARTPEPMVDESLAAGMEEDSKRTVIYERMTRVYDTPVAPTSSSSPRSSSPVPVAVKGGEANLLDTLYKLKPVFVFLIHHPFRFLRHYFIPFLYSCLITIIIYSWRTLAYFVLNLALPILNILFYPFLVLFSPFIAFYQVMASLGPLWRFLTTAIGVGAAIGLISAVFTEYLAQALNQKGKEIKRGWTARLEKIPIVGSSPSKYNRSSNGGRTASGSHERMTGRSDVKGKGRAMGIGSSEYSRRRSFFEPTSTTLHPSTTLYDEHGEELGMEEEEEERSFVVTPTESSKSASTFSFAEGDRLRQRSSGRMSEGSY